MNDPAANFIRIAAQGSMGDAMLRFVTVMFALAAYPVLAAEAFPKLDIQSTCKAAVPLVSEDSSPQESCLKDETEARDELDRNWASFPVALRERCIQEAHIGGYPSYVDALTCIQMATGNEQKSSKTTYRRPGR